MVKKILNNMKQIKNIILLLTILVAFSCTKNNKKNVSQVEKKSIIDQDKDSIDSLNCEEYIIDNMYLVNSINTYLYSDKITSLTFSNFLSKTKCYSDPYIKIIKVKPNSLDTIYLVSYLLYEENLKIIKHRNNIIFINYYDDVVGLTIFYILDLNKNVLFVSKIFEEHEEQNYIQEYRSTYGDNISIRDELFTEYKLINFNSRIYKLSSFVKK